MTIRTAQDVIAIAEARGFKVLVNPGPPPMPFLRGPLAEGTEPLVEALKAFRLEVIEEVQRKAAT